MDFLSFFLNIPRIQLTFPKSHLSDWGGRNNSPTEALTYIIYAKTSNVTLYIFKRFFERYRKEQYGDLMAEK